jgi:hypothetical protein
MEAEVYAIPDVAVDRDGGFVAAWLDAAEALRGEFELPAPSHARDIDVAGLRGVDPA